MKREKFTTTLNPKVIERLGIMKALEKQKGINDVIEKLVNDKWEETNDKHSKERM